MKNRGWRLVFKTAVSFTVLMVIMLVYTLIKTGTLVAELLTVTLVALAVTVVSAVLLKSKNKKQ
ncbi:MAG: hypothetical protein J6L81_01675 [Clostridia bacterium]|nr:hypothetical protein [Clostridia bacterium]